MSNKISDREQMKNCIKNLSNSEIENNVQICLTNLKILAKIKNNNKLSYYDNTFHIDDAGYAQGVRRWWSAESRNETIKNLDQFINTVFITIDAIYNRECIGSSFDTTNTYYLNITNRPSVFKEENSNLLIEFNKEISNAIIGLNNLKHTYKNDIATVSSLEIIIEKLNVRAKKIAEILKVNAITFKKMK